ncbi:peptidoglycan-binding protein [Bradyrhizobium centrosematis]|uniref:peptidoglycan-binding domain-containing protein n=1 Tax=Bradyrhizobium centrosematis TaxID=1300039 RepID=UPI00388E0A97
MAEPPIKITLESAEFTTDVTPGIRSRLLSCLRSDPQHILPKYRGGRDGKEVEAIQQALKKINATWPAEMKMPEITDKAGEYGPTTVAAVRKYKEVNAIQRTGQPLDDIVGRMTISRLDEELKNLRLRPVPPPKPPPPGPLPPEPVNRPFAFCRQNTKIFIDGTDAVKRTVPLNPVVYVNDTLATFDTICANPLGRKLVESVRENLVVKPYLETDVNALTDGRVAFIRGWHIEFSPDIFATSASQAGARADEVLLHELIHFWEHNFRQYDNAADGSLIFDDADFLTVNGTNVYSTSIARSPRKDHRGFQVLPGRYATDAREHMILYRENYEKGFDNNRELFGFFKNQAASFNPFASFTRDVSKTVFIAEVATQNWKWRFDLFSDSTARWVDTRNPGQFGVGAWRQDGGTIVIDWKGGGFDRFPEAGPGQFVTGENKTGGVVRDSLVVKQ